MLNPPGPPVNSTSLNYTGQRLDGTDLLYYHARYYDPRISRFVSPDSVVPGIQDGKGGAADTVGAEQNHRLTVDFHEPGFANSLHKEHDLTLQKGFWFQLEEKDRKDVKDPWGPINPQALNRYAYVLNNPVRYTDPTGHVAWWVAGAVFGGLLGLAEYGLTCGSDCNWGDAVKATAGGAVTGVIGAGIGVLAGKAIGWAVGKVASRAATQGGKLLWGSWNDYSKVVMNGKEYAQIGNGPRVAMEQ